MRISDLLPFSEHARLVNSRYEEALVSDLTFPRGLTLPEGITPDDAIEYFVTMGRVVTVFQMHDDLSVMVADLMGIEYRFLAALPGDTLVTVQIQEKDYHEVLSNLRFDQDGGAYYDLVGVSDYSPLPGGYSEAINEASLGDYSSLMKIVTESWGEEIVEDLQEGRLKPGSGAEIKRLPIDDIAKLVTNYLTSRAGSSRVPVLIGNTAVTKSALVKDVVKKLGLRLVDFRCAFLDKMDIEGFRDRTKDPETGDILSTTAPPEKLLECTDEYINYARKTSEELRRKIPGIQDEQEREATQRVLDRLEYQGRAPVLFFDEVTRATKAVQNAFVQILNQKSYRGMTFDIARIIAATNLPVDMDTKDLDFQNAYLTTAIRDAGIVERYEPVVVRPEDVMPSWFEFIETKGDFDSTVVRFLNKNKRYAYFMQHVKNTVLASKLPGRPSPVEKNPLVEDESDVGVIPFPNFRTWEFVSTHMKAVKDGKTPLNPKLVEGFLGKNEVSQAFLEAAKQDVPSELQKPPGDDDLSESVESALRSSVPIMLLGMTSIGKTSRVNKIAEGIGARVVTINLAQMDRVDVQGAPAKLSVSETFSNVAGGTLPPDVEAILNKNVSEVLPFTPSMTRMLPDFYIQESIKAAQSVNQRVVLFFDEVNRADKNTLSAVLEAVSDHKFGGVEFPWICTEPGHEWSGVRDKLVKGKCPLGHKVEAQVIVVAAANYGDKYKGAGKMDPAIAGRFSVITKLQFDDGDKKMILDFMRASTNPKYPPLLISFIESKPLDDLKTMLSSVETRRIDEAAPSLRAWSDLAKAMNQIEDPALRGDLPDEEWEKNLQLGHSSLDEIEKLVWSIPDNWAGLQSDQTMTIESETFTIPEFVEEIKEAVNNLKQGGQGDSWFGGPHLSPAQLAKAMKDMNGYLFELAKINAETRKYREREFTSKFGRRYTLEFLPYYNQNIGKSFFGIRDVVSKQMVWKYGEQLLSSTESPNEKRDALLSFMEDFFSTFKDGAPVEMYSDILDFISEKVPALDMLLDMLLLYTVDGFSLVRGFLNKALNTENTMRLANKLYLTSLKETEVRAYYQSGSAPRGTDGFPPRVAGGTP